jgi:hypothetical protein
VFQVAVLVAGCISDADTLSVKVKQYRFCQHGSRDGRWQLLQPKKKDERENAGTVLIMLKIREAIVQ